MLSAVFSSAFCRFDTVHVLRDDGRIRGFVVGGDNPVPRARRESSRTIVATTLTKVVRLPEQVAIIHIVQRTDLENRRRARTG